MFCNILKNIFVQVIFWEISRDMDLCTNPHWIHLWISKRVAVCGVSVFDTGHSRRVGSDVNKLSDQLTLLSHQHHTTLSSHHTIPHQRLFGHHYTYSRQHTIAMPHPTTILRPRSQGDTGATHRNQHSCLNGTLM